MKNFYTLLFGSLIAGILFFPAMNTSAKTWQVGASRLYKTPSAVSALVGHGDTVLIDTGTYSGDVAVWSKSNLLLKGSGKFARLYANGKSAQGKAIWVIAGENTTIENMEFTGCTVIDQNGAGIRLEGKGLTVRNCYFHDNDDGILGGTTGTVLVEKSEFFKNGYGDGYSHNIYINNVDTFILQFCYMHHAKVGHEVKSRAHVNFIRYNRIMTELSGSGSREIDLPNGGLAIVIGNLLEKGPMTQNSNFIGFGLEGLKNRAPHRIYAINNTFVNDRGANGILFSIQSGTSLFKACNNLFAGSPFNFLSGSDSITDTFSNLFIPDKYKAGLTDPVNYDYRLNASSPCINRGSNPGMAGTYSLTPQFQYFHPDSFTVRIQAGATDIGAYEYQPATGICHEIHTATPFLSTDRTLHTLSISIPDNESIKNFMVVNSSGTVIFKKESISPGYFTWFVPVLQPGIYLVKYNYRNGVSTKKLFLQ